MGCEATASQEASATGLKDVLRTVQSTAQHRKQPTAELSVTMTRHGDSTWGVRMYRTFTYRVSRGHVHTSIPPTHTHACCAALQPHEGLRVTWQWRFSVPCHPVEPPPPTGSVLPYTLFCGTRLYSGIAVHL